MPMQTLWAAARGFLFWAVPLVLVAVFAWTFVPRGGSVPPASPAPSAPKIGNPGPPSGDAARSEEAAEPSPADSPYAQIQRGDLAGTDAAGNERWRIVADQVTVVESKQTVLLRNVRATLFEKGGGTITVTGDSGRYDTKTHEVEITGRVHGKSTNGRELFADWLHWAPDSGKVTGSGHIKLIQERVIMYADRLIGDTTLGQTQFFGHVHAGVR